MTEKRNMDRRMFLRGAAGFTLALPFLPSLLPRASAAPPTKPKRFVQFCTHHGGVWGANMFPGDAVLTEKRAYAGHEIRRGDLVRTLKSGKALLVDGAGGAVDTAVLSASPEALTAAIVKKMNVLRGLDITFYIGHHTGGHLGNYARNDGNGDDGKKMQSQPRQTIDQVLAWSKSFYDDLTSIKKRVMLVGNRISYNFADPAARTGAIEEVTGTRNSLTLFDEIFVPPDAGGPKRAPIVDRVLADYKRMREGDRRLSTDDKKRLDEHMQRLSELQRRLTVTASCGGVSRPGKGSSAVTAGSGYDLDPARQAEFYGLMNDVIVAAFICGTSRIAAINAGETFSTFKGDWHQDVAHKCATAAQQPTLARAHQWFFEKVWLDLVNKLDAVDLGDGTKLLDSTLCSWTQESGNYTHDAQSVPIVTAGGAGGAVKTGSYCDYRNLAKVVTPGDNPTEKKWIGLTYEQWLTTVLSSMGATAAETEAAGYGNKGVTFATTQWMPFKDGEIYPKTVFDRMGEGLPFLMT